MVTDAASRYHDLKAEPALVRTALEDFVPFGHFPAILRFYTLLEWLNAPGVRLESNDCAFTGPHPSESPQLGKLQCEGRVMVLFRELAQNLERPRLEALARALHVRLAPLDRQFEPGMIGTTITSVRYLGLGDDAPLGFQLMLSFWAWGDSDEEVMRHLERVVKNLGLAIRGAASEARG